MEHYTLEYKTGEVVFQGKKVFFLQGSPMLCNGEMLATRPFHIFLSMATGNEKMRGLDLSCSSSSKQLYSSGSTLIIFHGYFP